jgi:hypothetical protein
MQAKVTKANKGSTVQVSVPASEGCGTYWSLGGYVNARDLRDAARSANLDPKLFPADTTPASALRRAVADQAGKRIKVQSMAHGAWALIRTPERDEKASKVGRTVDPGVALTCRVDNATRTLVFDGNEQFDSLRYDIERGYATHLDQLDASQDLGGWLTDLALRLQGVAMRPRGGFYYLPPTAVDTWRQFVAVLQSVAPQCVVYELTLQGTESTIRAILDAAINEAEQATADLMEKINNGELGERALRARKDDCEKMTVKLENYEKLLGTSLDAIKVKVEQAGAVAMAAALIVSGEADANTGG